jgi:hypothetical protein
MNNVQAEELVEYVYLSITPPKYIKLISNSQVRLRRQGHVHELGGWPGRCCAVRFRSIGQGRRDRQAYGRNCTLNCNPGRCSWLIITIGRRTSRRGPPRTCCRCSRQPHRRKGSHQDHREAPCSAQGPRYSSPSFRQPACADWP